MIFVIKAQCCLIKTQQRHKKIRRYALLMPKISSALAAANTFL